MATRPSIFGERLVTERQRLGLSARAMAQAGGVSPASQSFYESSDRVPDARYLSAIEDVGVDVRFILLGERTTEQVRRLFDWELLGEIYVTVDEWLVEQGLALPPKKKMQLVKILFEHMADRGVVDRAKVAELMRAAA